MDCTAQDGNSRKGFTLIGFIITVVLMGVVAYSILSVFVTSGIRGINVDIYTVAQALAEGKMEETMALPFASVSSQSQTSFTGDFSSYSYEVAMDYVDASNLDLPVGYPTSYKKVGVIIRNSQLNNMVSIESLAVNF